MRFVHSADWQLGMTRHFLDADAQPRYTAARTDALRRIASVAREADAEFVVVCGDVFESNAVGARTVARALEALAAFDVPVYLLPGNHDPLDASSVLASAAVRRAPGVVVLDTPGVHEVRPGVELVAAPWTSKRPLCDLVAAATPDLPADGTVRIVVGHGAVDELSPDRDDPARIALAPLEDAVAAGRLHYVALGDRHSTTQVGSSGAVWYSGTQEVTDRVERDPGNVLVVEVSDASPPKVEPVRVGTWAFPVVRAELDSAADVEALAARLAALPAKDRTVLTLTLSGSLSLREKALLDDLLATQAHLLAGVQQWDRHSDLAVYADDDELRELGVGGFADGAVAELAAAAAAEGPAAETARDALSLLFRLAGGSGTAPA
ncbi:exonuclease SbcCD subunit D [Kineococcus sp. R8]|uniref:metallophosphoesterase family protein n=1 Tax=Kineococcus siccus TaxID=2696567 RepID=UPI001412E7B8|nr:exonuclease SbcCD subunit D [Kineococcus siccus]